MHFFAPLAPRRGGGRARAKDRHLQIEGGGKRHEIEGSNQDPLGWVRYRRDKKWRGGLYGGLYEGSLSPEMFNPQFPPKVSYPGGLEGDRRRNSAARRPSCAAGGRRTSSGGSRPTSRAAAAAAGGKPTAAVAEPSTQQWVSVSQDLRAHHLTLIFTHQWHTSSFTHPAYSHQLRISNTSQHRQTPTHEFLEITQPHRSASLRVLLLKFSNQLDRGFLFFSNTLNLASWRVFLSRFSRGI